MFGVLVESNPRPRGRRGGTVASVAVHAGIVLLGAWATAQSAPAPEIIAHPEVVLPPIHQPSEPVTPAAPPHGRREASETTVRVPDAPISPSLPVFDVPVGLPPVEQSLGDPFATTDLGHRVAINGVGRRDSGLAPGGVLENRMAEKPAVPLASNVPPEYPDILRSAAIEGTVEVEFIIDHNGRVRPGSIVSLRSDHARFLEAVREALANSRYLPAQDGGSPVAVRVRQRFAFVLDR